MPAVDAEHKLINGQGGYNLNVIIHIIILSMLFISSIKDIKSKKISMTVLLIYGLVICLMTFLHHNMTLLDRISGMLIGAFLLFISRVTKEQIGFGDGLVFIVTGLGIGFWDNLLLLCYSMSLGCMFALFMWAVKKVKRNSTFPFVPFIGMGYLILMLNKF